jgi:hypothetical protein
VATATSMLEVASQSLAVCCAFKAIAVQGSGQPTPTGRPPVQPLPIGVRRKHSARDLASGVPGHRGSFLPTDRRGRSHCPVGARRLTTRQSPRSPAPLTATCGPPHQSCPHGPADSDPKLPSHSSGDRAPNNSLLLRSCAHPPRLRHTHTHTAPTNPGRPASPRAPSRHPPARRAQSRAELPERRQRPPGGLRNAAEHLRRRLPGECSRRRRGAGGDGVQVHARVLRLADRGADCGAGGHGRDVRHHEAQARGPPHQAAAGAGAAGGHRLQVRRRARGRAPVLPGPEG